MPTETYSTQYTSRFLTTPPGKVFDGFALKEKLFDYAHVVHGAEVLADTIMLGFLPPRCTVLMLQSYVTWTGFASGATFSLGWKAYKDVNGVTVAASAAGLISAIVLTTAGTWHGGMLLATTPDDFNPVVVRRTFNSNQPVEIYATIGVEAMTSGDIFQVSLVFSEQP